MYMDPWNTNGGNSSNDNGANRSSRSDGNCQSAQPKTQRPPRPIRFNMDRFNEAVEAFFENARPPVVKRGSVPVPKVLVGYDYSAGGYLLTKYATPVTLKVEAWGLDVKDFREGRLTPRCFHA